MSLKLIFSKNPVISDINQPSQQQPKKKSIKILLLGNEDVGKSALINTFLNESKQTQNRVGDVAVAIDNNTEEIVHVDFFINTESYSITESDTQHYVDADCCILVYDIRDVSPFIDLNTIYDQTRTRMVAYGNPNGWSLPWFLIGTDDFGDYDKRTKDEDIDDFIEAYKIEKEYRISTQARYMVKECFDDIIKYVLKR